MSHDLTPIAALRAHAEEAIRAAEALDGRAVAAIRADLDPAGNEARAIVAAQKGVSRALVPLRYTTGDIFDRDPAIPAPAQQQLCDIPAFAALDPASGEARFLHTALVRRRSAVAQALRAAIAAANVEA